jgi:4-diphosphocytidyl-2-C-methyl-D-erythritol kinase
MSPTETIKRFLSKRCSFPFAQCFERTKKCLNNQKTAPDRHPCFSSLIAVFLAPDQSHHVMNVRAYAKINIGLHVLGKRPDGYHNIETIFRLIDLYDELEFVEGDEGIAFTSNTPLLANDNDNLCIRAANLLRDLTGVHMGVEITLKKHIPLGAGLGGGSSDAAAVLRGLTKLWSLDVSTEELQTISATLGSDVPFFFTSQTAYATGRGERLTPFTAQIPYWILVVTPNVHVSTGWAYSNVTPRGPQNRPDLRGLLETAIDQPEILRANLANDFEESVFREFRDISRLKESLLKEGADVALMSGSGSSVFGFFSSEAKANQLRSELSSKYFVSVTDPQFKPEIN